MIARRLPLSAEGSRLRPRSQAEWLLPYQGQQPALRVDREVAAPPGDLLAAVVAAGGLGDNAYAASHGGKSTGSARHSIPFHHVADRIAHRPQVMDHRP